MVGFITLNHVKDGEATPVKSCFRTKMILAFEEIRAAPANSLVILSNEIPHETDNDRYALVVESVDEIQTLMAGAE